MHNLFSSLLFLLAFSKLSLKALVFAVSLFFFQEFVDAEFQDLQSRLGVLPSNDKSELLQHFLPDTIVCPSLKSAVCKFAVLLKTIGTGILLVMELYVYQHWWYC